ncbi:MAG: ABC transporter permease [Chloroflexi bacterium]|nr:ABC transporter permease [Chloroflexota bacterium]
MSSYIVRRLLAVGPVLLGVSLVVFFMMKLIPGDIAFALAPPNATTEELDAIRASLGLNQPLPVQYVKWLGKVVQGDLGFSVSQGKPVAQLLLQPLQNTMILAAAALLISTSLGVTVGVISAVKRGTILDRGIMVMALLGNSMPGFWMGLMLILFFGLTLGWLPIGGMHSARGNGGPFDLAKHLILPALTLGAASAGLVARMTRSAMLEVLKQDYIRTAHSKGLTHFKVVAKHALKNAMLPVITVIGLQMGNLLGGSVITETVFSWPGIGFLMNSGISRRDVPIVQAGVLLSATVFVFINLFVDLLYAALDPRIKFN